MTPSKRLALALSSTAIATQAMTDRRQLATPTGQAALGILVFQGAVGLGATGGLDRAAAAARLTPPWALGRRVGTAFAGIALGGGGVLLIVATHWGHFG